MANSFEAKSKILPKLLVDKAYEYLTSGDKLTASELKVCLEVCKTFGVEVEKETPKNIISDLPFNDEEISYGGTA